MQQSRSEPVGAPNGMQHTGSTLQFAGRQTAPGLAQSLDFEHGSSMSTDPVPADAPSATSASPAAPASPSDEDDAPASPTRAASLPPQPEATAPNTAISTLPNRRTPMAGSA